MQSLVELDWAAYGYFVSNQIPELAAILRWICPLGSYPALVAIVLIVVIYLRTQGRFQAILFLLGCFLAGIGLVETLKAILGRDPPNPARASSFASYSFPCDSAMLSLIVYLGSAVVLTFRWTGWLVRMLLLLAPVLLTVLISFGEIYLGNHFVFDVVAGLLGGTVVLLAGGVVALFARESKG